MSSSERQVRKAKSYEGRSALKKTRSKSETERLESWNEKLPN